MFIRATIHSTLSKIPSLYKSGTRAVIPICFKTTRRIGRCTSSNGWSFKGTRWSTADYCCHIMAVSWSTSSKSIPAQYHFLRLAEIIHITDRWHQQLWIIVRVCHREEAKFSWTLRRLPFPFSQRFGTEVISFFQNYWCSSILTGQMRRIWSIGRHDKCCEHLNCREKFWETTHFDEQLVFGLQNCLKFSSHIWPQQVWQWHLCVCWELIHLDNFLKIFFLARCWWYMLRVIVEDLKTVGGA